MRQLLVGTALLIGALIVTFATASILQNLAVTKRAIVADPAPFDRTVPAATAKSAPRPEPGGRSLIRHAEL